MAGKASGRTKRAAVGVRTRSFRYATLWARTGRELCGGQWTVRRDGDYWVVSPPAREHTRV